MLEPLHKGVFPWDRSERVDSCVPDAHRQDGAKVYPITFLHQFKDYVTRPPADLNPALCRMIRPGAVVTVRTTSLFLFFCCLPARALLSP